MKSDCQYLQMIQSREWVPFMGQLLFLTDGRYVVLDMDCRVLPEPVDLIHINGGKIIYTFSDEGDVMCMMDRNAIMNAEY